MQLNNITGYTNSLLQHVNYHIQLLIGSTLVPDDLDNFSDKVYMLLLYSSI